MPRPKNATLSYLHHKPSNRAYVRLPDGAGGRKVIYLGEYNSPESKTEHARLLAGVAVAPSLDTAVLFVGTAPPDVTVNEIMLAFLRYAEAHYRRADGSQTDEVGQYKQTFRVVKDAYGHTPAREFGPKALKAVRQRMVDAGWSRKLINQRVGRVKRVFKWAASEELIPAIVYHALATVTGLQAGRTKAAERDPVKPVDDATVEATLPHLNRHVAGLVRFQRLTGCRPGEACGVRMCDIDTTAAVWLYRPPQHKTRHRGKPRVIAVGPQAQEVLKAFATADPNDYLFSPARAVAEFHAARTANRKTPKYASHMKRNGAKRVAAPKRKPAAKYTVTSYEHAIRRAVEKANKVLTEAGADPNRRVPHWAPNMLRHSQGTAVRARYGLDAAQCVLGHEHAAVSEIYAEKNLALAVKVAAELG